MMTPTPQPPPPDPSAWVLEPAGEERITTVVGADDDAEAEPIRDREHYCYTSILLGAIKCSVHRLTACPATLVLIEGDYEAMSPAAALALLRAAPDVRLIKRLIFLNHDHEEQRWLRHTTGKPLVIRAETCGPGAKSLCSARMLIRSQISPCGTNGATSSPMTRSRPGNGSSGLMPSRL